MMQDKKILTLRDFVWSVSLATAFITSYYMTISNYVPRTEIDAKLSAISERTDQVYLLLIDMNGER